MAEPVGSLRVDVAANVAAIRDDMRAITATVNSSTAQLRRMFQSTGDAINRSMGGMFSFRNIMATLTGGTILAAIGRFAKMGAEIEDMAKKTGVGAEQLQELRYAAELNGTSIEALNKALEQMNKRLGENSDGVSEVEIALGRLGLRLADVRRLSPDEAFRLIADRVSRLQDPMQRASILMGIFGRAGQEVGNMMRDGAAGIAAAAEEARRFGVIVDDATIKRAGEAADELDRIGAMLRAIGIKGGAEAEPALRKLRETLASKEFQELAAKSIGFVAGAAEKLAKFAKIAYEELSDVGRQLDQMADEDAAKRQIDDLTKSLNAFVAARTAAIARGETNLEPFDRPIEDITADIGKITAHLEDLRKKKVEVQQTPTNPLPRSATPSSGDNGGFDARRMKEINDLIANLQFRTQLLRQEFKLLPPGAAEAIRSIEELGDKSLKAYVETGKLPPALQKIADAQMKLNAAMLVDEVKTPFERFADDLFKLNQLFQAGEISLDTYTRKLYQLKQGLVQATGVGVDLQNAAQGIGTAFGNAMDTAIQEGKYGKDELVRLLREINAAITQAFITKPITGWLTNLLNDGKGGGFLSSLMNMQGSGDWFTKVLPSAKGNVISQGRITPFAKGAAFSSPMSFPMKGGTGILAEAGPEAILPLERGADGRLGVAGGGGGDTYNIDARGADIGAFERMQHGIAEMERQRKSAVAQVTEYSRKFPYRRT